MSSGSNGLRLRSHLAAGWASGFSRGAIKPPANIPPKPQAIGRLLSSLIVLERHLWLTMTEMKEADKVPFLERSGLVRQPVWTSCGGLCGTLYGGSEVVSNNATILPETQQLLPVALNLRHLSSQLSQRQPLLSPDLIKLSRIECIHARQDATPYRSAKDLSPRLPWIRHLRSPPD